MMAALGGFASKEATVVKESLELAKRRPGGLRWGRVVMQGALEQALVLRGWTWEVGDGQLRSCEPAA